MADQGVPPQAGRKQTKHVFINFLLHILPYKQEPRRMVLLGAECGDREGLGTTEKEQRALEVEEGDSGLNIASVTLSKLLGDKPMEGIRSFTS